MLWQLCLITSRQILFEEYNIKPGNYFWTVWVRLERENHVTKDERELDEIQTRQLHMSMKWIL